MVELDKAALDFVRSKASGTPRACRFEVTINFHPDRMTTDDRPLLAAIYDDGILKSQFETKTSNGGVTAFPGGKRWEWEHRMFGGVYDDSAAAHRPKYGALNHRSLPMGAAPRFGSAFFRCKAAVLERTSFCFPDSHLEPQDFATAETVTPLIELCHAADFDFLDDYVEAQVHDVLDLSKDIEAVVIDPAFRGTEIERLAKRLPTGLEWHDGFQIPVSIVEENPDYRRASLAALAAEIASGGILNPRLLGLALGSGKYRFQDIKMLWHYLARFGYRD